MSPSLSVRTATHADVEIVAKFVKNHSNPPNSLPLDAIAVGFKRNAFPDDGSRPIAGAALAEDANGSVIAVAVFTDWFSTWQGRPILSIQHLSTLPNESLKTVFKPMLKHLAGLAVERRATRLQWNTGPEDVELKDLSKEVGAHELPEWLDVVVSHPNLESLSRRNDGLPSRTELVIRPAEPRDELAEFENEPDQAKASHEDTELYHFPKVGAPVTETVIAERNGVEVGFAMWLFVYDPYTSSRSLYLEDLYITPQARKHRIGTQLLSHLASIAVNRDCLTYRWQVLDWNKGAIGFYEKMGGKVGSGKIMTRIEGDLLVELAAK
ncbi:acyl-CoA N-acyltransferase [Gonapodya prolifera JEL478]|uniref:Acyl-CoA N-acyltransferase n=1 Tax=Gonapodya prolifera (strain JEL478) TaxID=1344416 RepID=A0A138ZZS4_GONPJ|nr:acyl-CoA N-acyltransferase [Gonapodya prolifera JEL478]|eukprot:KXS09775.1 acyl-CoA N-acyltransferase [Gonapodya prolifera JEL478]